MSAVDLWAGDRLPPPLAELVEVVDLWHHGAFADDTPQDVALCLGEEAAELVEALTLGRELTIAVGKVQRTILKEGHGANDRRALVDWRAERYGEVGDVLIALAKIAAADGFDLTQCLLDRITYVHERFPGSNGAYVAELLRAVS